MSTYSRRKERKTKLHETFKTITGVQKEEEIEQFLAAGSYNLANAVDIFYSGQDNSARPPKNSKANKNGQSTSAQFERNEQSTSDHVDVCMLSDDDEGSSSHGVPGAVGNEASASSNQEMEEVRAPIEFRSGAILNQTFEQQYQGGRPVARQAATSVFEGAYDFRSLARSQESSMRAGLDPMEQLNDAGTSLQILFKPPLDILYQGNWEAARLAAQSSHKWLLVNVQDVKEFACQLMNRDVWSMAGVKELIRCHFIFWQILHESPDGIRMTTYYNVKKFPAVFIVDPRTGEQVYTLLMNALKDPVSLCDALTKFMDMCPDFATHDRLTLGDAAPIPSEMPEIDQAQLSTCNPNVNKTHVIQMSKKPSSVQFQHGVTGEGLLRPERKRKQQEDEEAPCSSKKSRSNGYGVEPELREEAAQMTIVDPSEYLKHICPNGHILKVSLKFPDGSRKIVDVTEHTKLMALFVLISSFGLNPSEHFLVMSFPKRELDLKEHGEQTLKELCFAKQELLHVELK